MAKRRLADEYDAAQLRGEVRAVGNPNYSKAEGLPSAAEIGLSGSRGAPDQGRRRGRTWHHSAGTRRRTGAVAISAYWSVRAVRVSAHFESSASSSADAKDTPAL